MILVLAFVLALAWSLARGGRLSHLQTWPIQALWRVLTALLIQLIVIYLPPAMMPGEELRVVLLGASYLLLASFVWSNRRLPGMWLIGAGLVANWAVMLANGGYMPVTYEALVAAGRGHLVDSAASGTRVFGSKDILLPLAETKLWFLSDLFVVPPPFPVPSVFSIGDVLIAGGIFRLVGSALGTSARNQSCPAKPESV